MTLFLVLIPAFDPQQLPSLHHLAAVLLTLLLARQAQGLQLLAPGAHDLSSTSDHGAQWGAFWISVDWFFSRVLFWWWKDLFLDVFGFTFWLACFFHMVKWWKMLGEFDCLNSTMMIVRFFCLSHPRFFHVESWASQIGFLESLDHLLPQRLQPAS